MCSVISITTTDRDTGRGRLWSARALPSQVVQVILCFLSGVLAIIPFGTTLLMMPSSIRAYARLRVKVVKSVDMPCRESTPPIKRAT